MKLTEAQFVEVTESLTQIDSATSVPQPGDRRSTRVALNSQLQLTRWSAPQTALSVRLRNFSVGGLGILHSERVSLDEKLVARLPLKNGGSLLLLSTVIYWEPLSENLYSVGTQFERALTEQEWIDRTSEATSHPQGVFARITQVVNRALRAAS